MAADRTTLDLVRDPVHDPGVEEAKRRADAVAGAARKPLVIAGGRIRIGTAGWTDPTLTAPGVF